MKLSLTTLVVILCVVLAAILVLQVGGVFMFSSGKIKKKISNPVQWFKRNTRAQILAGISKSSELIKETEGKRLETERKRLEAERADALRRTKLFTITRSGVGSVDVYEGDVMKAMDVNIPVKLLMATPPLPYSRYVTIYKQDQSFKDRFSSYGSTIRGWNERRNARWDHLDENVKIPENLVAVNHNEDDNITEFRSTPTFTVTGQTEYFKTHYKVLKSETVDAARVAYAFTTFQIQRRRS
jgi:RNAse (barnase) inhibitor barstar